MIETKDYLVSGETYNLKPSAKYQELYYTYPTPLESDLEKYYKSDSYISHTDNAKGIVNKMYYWIKQYNFRYKKGLLLKDGRYPKKVLDYGCGTGEFVQYLNNNRIDTFGYEPNDKAFKVASNKLPLKVHRDDSILLNNKFDVITLFHVLEHLPNLEESLETIINGLNPDGFLLIAVPNYKSFDAKYYKEHWAAYDVPRHLWHFSEESIKDIFSRFGMIIESTYPLWFDAFYISLISEKYKKNKLGFLTAPIVGGISNIFALFNKQYSSKIYKIVFEN